VLLSGALAVAQTTTKQAAPARPPAAATARTQQNPGERVFQANCNRCHWAPQQLSPRITGTVVRHMRVRASLNAEDEKAILKYLAP
jgi:cytochrome c5